MASVIAQLKARRLAKGDAHRQRVVGVLEQLDLRDFDRRVGDHLLVQGIALNQHHVIEQRPVHLGAGLDLGHRQVLVSPTREHVLVKAGKQIAEAVGLAPAGAHRDRVDEQPQHALDAWNLFGTVGDHGAEDHVVAVQ